MMARAFNARLGSAALAAALGLMAGCSMVHDNVKGGFLCQAPKGVCAPSTSIDDAALGQISAEHGADILPASDPDMGMGMGMGMGMARDMARSKHGRAAPMLAAARRPALRVVHPAWRDSQGRRHERTVDYAYVDAAAALGYAARSPENVADNASGDDSLLAVAERAPELAAVSRPALPAADDIPPPGAIAQPYDVIQAKVAAILANAPKPVSTPSATPETSPARARIGSSEAAARAKSAVTFPPAGS